MITARTVVVADPLARASVMTSFAGSGAPGGVVGCTCSGQSIVVEFDDDRTSAGLIDALAAVATAFVPARGRSIDDLSAAARIASRGLDEPALDASRIIETYLA